MKRSKRIAQRKRRIYHIVSLLLLSMLASTGAFGLMDPVELPSALFISSPASNGGLLVGRQVNESIQFVRNDTGDSTATLPLSNPQSITFVPNTSLDEQPDPFSVERYRDRLVDGFLTPLQQLFSRSTLALNTELDTTLSNIENFFGSFNRIVVDASTQSVQGASLLDVTLLPSVLPTIPATPTMTPTQTATPTETSTVTPTFTATATETTAPTDTPTSTSTWTITPTPTVTETPTETATPSETPVLTETPTATLTPTETQPPTAVPPPTATFTETPLPTPTITLFPTFTRPPTHTPVATTTPIPTATFTLTPTQVPLPTTAAPVVNTAVTATVLPTPTPIPTVTIVTSVPTPTVAPPSFIPPVPVADLEPEDTIPEIDINLSASAGISIPGGQVEFTPDVTNIGNVTFENSFLLITIPELTTFNGSSAGEQWFLLESNQMSRQMAASPCPIGAAPGTRCFAAIGFLPPGPIGSGQIPPFDLQIDENLSPEFLDTLQIMVFTQIVVDLATAEESTTTAETAPPAIVEFESTPTTTPTGTATATATETATPTETGTGTLTVTATETATPTEMGTGTLTVTATETATPTETGTGTLTATATEAATPTETGTGTLTVTATETTTPTETGTGAATATLTITATVAENATATTTGTATITPTPTAIRPKPPIDIRLSNDTVSEDAPSGTVVALLSATDLNVGDNFTYALAQSGAGNDHNALFSVVGEQLILNRALDFESLPQLSIRLEVNDGTYTIGQPFIIAVIDIDEPPVFTSVAIETGVEGAFYGYNIRALSDAGDPLTFTALSLPTWLTLTDLGDGTANLSGTPNASDVESYPMTLQVTDGSGQTDQQLFTITIIAGTVTPTPTWTPTEIPTVTETPTVTSTPIPTALPTNTPTKTTIPSTTPTETATHTPTFTPTNTATPTPTFTPSLTFTPTPTFTPTAIPAELEVVQSAIPANVFIGDTITYTINYTNNGSGRATGVTIVDNVPAQVTGLNVTSSGPAISNSGTGQNYAWTITDLSPTDNGTIVLVGQITTTASAGTFANTATIATTSTDANPANNSSAANVTINPCVLVVDNLGDVNDRNTSSGQVTLREAIACAVSGDTITFDAGVSEQTITLVEQLTIDKSLTISGTVPITISGNSAVRIFELTAGNVTLENLILTDALSGGGGAIKKSSNGTLTINDSTLNNNQATGTHGGAVSADSGTVIVNHSTINGNTAAGHGGGIYVTDAVLTVVQSTIHGNSSGDRGGGIRTKQASILTIENSTIVQNTSVDEGGGVSIAVGGTATIKNSTLAGNSSGTDGGGLYNAGTLHIYNTIVADNSGSADCESVGSITTKIKLLTEDDSCNANLDGDPSLGPLQDNGGETHTMALLAGSLAINKVDNATGYCPTTDQRGEARSDGSCDIGAYEAGPSPYTFVDSGQTLGSSTSYDVVLADLDGDGDLDGYVANYGSSDKVWLNDGVGTFSDSGQSLDTGNAWDMHLGDIDNNGSVDAFIANWGQADTVWKNDGSGNFTSGQSLTPSGNSTGNDSVDVKLGDLDGDGDKDAYVAYWDTNAANTTDNHNKVWLNDGTGSFTTQINVAPATFIWGIDMGDVNGDGTLDIFIAAAGNGASSAQDNQLWLNNGSASFTAGTVPTGGRSRDVRLADLNGDTHKDAFIANAGGSANWVWLNDGTGTFSDSGQTLGNGDSWAVVLGDVDGDGDIDAYVSNDGGSNKLWLNDGTGTFTDSGQDFGTSASRDAALGDFNGDGHIDIFVANAASNEVWLNSGP